MSPVFFYKVFNLVLASPIECHELLPTTQRDADVHAVFGAVPDNLSSIEKKGDIWEINSRQILLNISDVASFLIEDGNKITISNKNNSSNKLIRLFLLGSVLGAVQHQRLRLILHASALTNGKNTLVICGRSGAGKSTTANKLIQQGYKLMSDDLAVIDFIHGKPWVMPAYPQSKLWPDATENLDINTEGLCFIREDIDKYAYPLQGHFCNEPREITHIIVLDKNNNGKPSFVNLDTIDKLFLMKRHTYKKKFLNGVQISNNFKSCANLVNTTPVVKLSRPKNGNSLADVSALITTQFLN